MKRLMVGLVLLVLGILMNSSCDPFGLENRIDVYIMNCGMDNIRILGLGTNIHVELDESCNEINKQYLASLDANVPGKLFSLERSVGGCQALLDIELTDEALMSFNQSEAEAKCGGDINLKLTEDPRGVFSVQNSDSICLMAGIQGCP
jgi:hypothetical protein